MGSVVKITRPSKRRGQECAKVKCQPTYIRLTNKQRAGGLNLPRASIHDRCVRRPRAPRTTWLGPAVLHILGSQGRGPEAHTWPCGGSEWALVPPARATARRRVRPLGGTQPSPNPAVPTHIVDDHGLVGDDVVGLHGRAEPALPSRWAAGGPAGYKASGRTRTAATLDGAPRPSPSTLPTPTQLCGQSQRVIGLIDGERRGGLLRDGGGDSWSWLAN